MPPQELKADLAGDLQQAIRGEVRLDQLTRQLYSTDASSYQVMPVGVVVPRDVDDLSAAIKVAARHKIPIIPRGGGTSLSGQTIGNALILDQSRYLDQILELNIAERWVRAEAGVVLDRLNTYLRPHGLMVGPDPASSMAATIGGMTGNNSTGSHSIRYGMMIDHVREVEVVLADGTRAHFGPKTKEAVAALARLQSLEGSLYREIPRLIEQYRDDIATGYPPIWRSVAGYQLNRMLAEADAGKPFSLAPLIVGSEGTLATITSVTLSLVPRPARTHLVLLHYDDLRAGLEAVPLILQHDPAAVELIDRSFLQLTRLTPEYGPRLTFIEGDPRIVLIVEFAGDTDVSLKIQASALIQRLRGLKYRGAIIQQTKPEDVANVWTVRKAGLGLLMSGRGDAKPLAFVDDAAVPVARLADYALEVERVCHEVGTEASFYAHASAGCLHINPMINLKTAEGLRQMRVISEAVAALAIAHGGTTTGEHGEGLARSYFNEQLFGPRLHQAFRELKGIFDPHNLQNPGKIVNAPAPWTPSILRFSPEYRVPLAPIKTHFDFTADGGFAGLVEMCNGQGVCRKRETGVMCPSFMATRDEANSTRGYANALRAAMTGDLGAQGLASPELHKVLDMCLECKGCKRECPSLVDMAKLKYEFLAQYQAVHGTPLRSRVFAGVARFNRLASRTPTLANAFLRNGMVRSMLDRTLGIDQRRILPELAPRTFQKWFRRRAVTPEGSRGSVILWDDTYLSYNEPQIGEAAVRVLEAAGFKVRLLVNRGCCGRPMISKGMLDDARKHAAHNVGLLAPLAMAGMPIIGLEPSCIATFRDEYPDLLGTEQARSVAAHSFFIEEFLTTSDIRIDFPTSSVPRRILVHGHCYQKALTGTAPLLNMLRMLPNTTVEEIQSGCCGMAGSYGYEREHYDVSLACGEDRLFPAVREADRDTVIAAAGISCRHQIAHGTQRQARHPIQIMAEALDT